MSCLVLREAAVLAGGDEVADMAGEVAAVQADDGGARKARVLESVVADDKVEVAVQLVRGAVAVARSDDGCEGEFFAEHFCFVCRSTVAEDGDSRAGPGGLGTCGRQRSGVEVLGKPGTEGSLAGAAGEVTADNDQAGMLQGLARFKTN